MRTPGTTFCRTLSFHPPFLDSFYFLFPFYQQWVLLFILFFFYCSRIITLWYFWAGKHFSSFLTHFCPQSSQSLLMFMLSTFTACTHGFVRSWVQTILLYTIYCTSVVWQERTLNYKWNFFSGYSSGFNFWIDTGKIS